jgi:hypothetical protein
VVDLAIAANFVRELTEEQFEEPRPKAHRRAREGGAPKGAVRKDAVRRGHAGGAEATLRPFSPRARSGSRLAATRLGRTLSRLAQVRG